jgi:hypothetical protein
MNLTSEKELHLPVLRDHAGWTATSSMPEVYLHYFGTESSTSLLEAHGIIKKSKEKRNLLSSIQCPNCGEPNKPDGRFCVSCKMVLKYDSYMETIENDLKKEKVIEKLIEKQEKFEQLIQSLIDSGQLKPSESRVW